MIRVEITRSGTSNIRGAVVRSLEVCGHAGYAAHGEDIVCAAASATAFTAAGALEELCGAPPGCATERDGYFKLDVPAFADGDTAYRSEIIMEAACIGYRQIQASYPDYITVSEKVI